MRKSRGELRIAAPVRQLQMALRLSRLERLLHPYANAALAPADLRPSAVQAVAADILASLRRRAGDPAAPRRSSPLS